MAGWTVIAGWRGVAAGAALVVTAGAGVWAYGSAQYRAGERAAQAAQERAELLAWRAESERLTGLSADLVYASNALRTAQPRIIEKYTHATTIQPLPADCVLDPGRLRSINDAIDASNAAGQPSATLRARGAAADR